MKIERSAVGDGDFYRFETAAIIALNPITKHQTTNPITPRIIEIQANIFACLAALVAPSIHRPGSSCLPGWQRPMKPLRAVGNKPMIETTVAMIARIMLFGTVAAHSKASGEW